MGNNFGRSRIIEIFALIITISCLFTFFNKKPLGEFVDMETVTGDTEIHMRWDKEVKTENGTSYLPEDIKITADKNNAAVKSVFSLLSQTQARKVKGQSSILVAGVNLETIYAITKDGKNHTEFFISNEHSIIYVTVLSDGRHIETAYDVPEDTFEKLKEIILEYYPE